MLENLKKYIDKHFINIEPTSAASQLKQELTNSLIDYYYQALNSGSTKEDSYKYAVETLGEINILIKCLVKTNELKIKKE